MIATWMSYSLACGFVFTCAGLLAERMLLAGRIPVRHVWTAVLSLSLFVPIALVRVGGGDPVSDGEATRTEGRQALGPEASTHAASVQASNVETRDLLPRQSRSQAQYIAVRSIGDWSTRASVFDHSLAMLWGGLSLAFGAYCCVGCAALAVMRRTWHHQTVLGVHLLVSEATGPAVVGAIKPTIVLPGWMLDVERSRLATMLQHESEHMHARDGQLLMMAQLTLLVMPWNVCLWWQLRRLRIAVELDCDDRVLRNGSTDTRTYGNLLLDVVHSRRIMPLIGVTAFADRAPQLERRIHVMTRRREQILRGANTKVPRFAAFIIATATMTGAWSAPRPGVLNVSLMRSERVLWSTEMADAFSRNGTSGIINPALLTLRQADAIQLDAEQADNLAALNREFRVRLDSIWRPVSQFYSSQQHDATSQIQFASAPQLSIQLLQEMRLRIHDIVREDQVSKLPSHVSKYLDRDVLAQIATRSHDPDAGLFEQPPASASAGPRLSATN